MRMTQLISRYLPRLRQNSGFRSFAILGLIALPFTAQAERKPVALGLVGGVTGSTLWGKDIHEFETHIWVTTGLTLAFHLPAFLGLEADLLYVNKNGTFSRENTKDTVQVNQLTAHALEMPLLLKVTVPTEFEVQPVFYGGWSFAYWLSKNFTSGTNIISESGMLVPVEEVPQIAHQSLPTWEQSLIIGGGVEWGLGTFQLRFSLGQNSIDESGKLDIKTVITTVMAGFIF